MDRKDCRSPLLSLIVRAPNSNCFIQASPFTELFQQWRILIRMTDIQDGGSDHSHPAMIGTVACMTTTTTRGHLAVQDPSRTVKVPELQTSQQQDHTLHVVEIVANLIFMANKDRPRSPRRAAADRRHDYPRDRDSGPGSRGYGRDDYRRRDSRSPPRSNCFIQASPFTELFQQWRILIRMTDIQDGGSDHSHPAMIGTVACMTTTTTRGHLAVQDPSRTVKVPELQTSQQQDHTLHVVEIVANLIFMANKDRPRSPRRAAADRRHDYPRDRDSGPGSRGYGRDDYRRRDSRSPPRRGRQQYKDRDREGYRSGSHSRSRSPRRGQPHIGNESREVMMEGFPVDMTEDDVRFRNLSASDRMFVL